MSEGVVATSAGGSYDVGIVGGCGLVFSEAVEVTDNIYFSSSVVRVISHVKLKSGFPPSLFRKFPVTGVERIGGQRRAFLHPCGTLGFPKGTFLPSSRELSFPGSPGEREG